MGRQDLSPRGLKLNFHLQPSNAEWDHLHPEELAISHIENGVPEYVIAGDTGHVLHVSAFGHNFYDARRSLDARIANLVVPRMFYRTDIGLRFMEHDRALLVHWGWLNNHGVKNSHYLG